MADEKKKGPVVVRKKKLPPRDAAPHTSDTNPLPREAGEAGRGGASAGPESTPHPNPPPQAGEGAASAGDEVAAPAPRVFHSERAKPRLEPPPAPELPEPVEAESFAEMFARSEGKRERHAPGQKVRARILQIGRDTAFLELGGKTEALIEARELCDEQGAPRFGVGAFIEGYVRSVDDGVWVTLTIPKGARREALAQAREAGIPVAGTVTAVNKGGLEVDLGGGTRAFCPASQVELRFTEDLAPYVGKRFEFLVTELRDRDVVLSRSKLLARESAAKAEALRASLEVGAQLPGKVVALREFGAFVDIGGIEGLVPVSELSHRHVAHPKDLLEIGQTVTVEVARIETGKDGKERIALSLKALEEDPWEEKGNAVAEGQRMAGRVVRLQPFGAFVELFPGVDGLVHVSRITTEAGRRVAHPKEVLAEGQEVFVEVDTVDRAARKIGLRLITAEEAAQPAPRPSGPPRVGDVVAGTVDRVEGFGLFLRWPGGRGLLPVSEMEGAHGANLKAAFPIGTAVKAAIVEVDATGRIRLSQVAAARAEERAEVDAWMRSSRPAGKGLGTLGEILASRGAGKGRKE